MRSTITTIAALLALAGCGGQSVSTTTTTPPTAVAADSVQDTADRFLTTPDAKQFIANYCRDRVAIAESRATRPGAWEVMMADEDRKQGWPPGTATRAMDTVEARGMC